MIFFDEVRRQFELLAPRLVSAFTFDEAMYVEVAALLTTLFIIRTLIGK